MNRQLGSFPAVFIIALYTALHPLDGGRFFVKGELHMELKKRNAEGYMDPTAYEAIQKVAELLEQSVRKDDVVIRYGGDEFMMVFFDITKEDLENKLSFLQTALK